MVIFGDFIKCQLKQKIDVSALEQEREQLRRQLRQLSDAKKKLMDMLDNPDVSDKHYDRKYQDMQDRLDSLYDKIGDIEDMVTDINEIIHSAYSEHLTAKEIFKEPEHFDIINGKCMILRKRNLSGALSRT